MFCTIIGKTQRGIIGIPAEATGEASEAKILQRFAKSTQNRGAFGSPKRVR
jgi:hypothetical protein